MTGSIAVGWRYVAARPRNGWQPRRRHGNAFGLHRAKLADENGGESPRERPDLGIPRGQVEALFGWYYATISQLGATLSCYSGAIKERIGIRLWFVGVPFVVGGGLVAMYFVPPLAIVALPGAQSIATPTRALASHYVNDLIASLGRATVLSAIVMVSGLTVVPFQLGGGALSDLVSPEFALAVAGAILIDVSATIL